MKRIPLTKGRFATVWDCDLLPGNWCYNKRGYACRRRKKSDGTGSKMILMHRVIAERAGMRIDGLEVDHIDGDRLNNRRSNLRVATLSQNQFNRPANKNNTSGYKGVCWCGQTRKWQAAICVMGRSHKLGRFPDKIEAARAYNEAALKYHGEFACLNQVSV